jgi:hypothetical protein
MMLAHSGILAVVASVVLLAAPASARTYLGNINMIKACNEQYGSEWTARLNGRTFNDWSCVDKSGNSKVVNVKAYCVKAYGEGAYSDPQGGGSNDWGCFRQ